MENSMGKKCKDSEPDVWNIQGTPNIPETVVQSVGVSNDDDIDFTLKGKSLCVSSVWTYLSQTVKEEDRDNHS